MKQLDRTAIQNRSKKFFPRITFGRITIALALILSITGGVAISKPENRSKLEHWSINLLTKLSAKNDLAENSTVFPLINLTPEERRPRLLEIAESDIPSVERSRARFLLASDLINQGKGGEALKLLEDIELDYQPMKPYILLKRARAYELTNGIAKAQETWKSLIKQYPNSPASGEALYQLGKDNPKYQDQLITNYPYHPRAEIILRQRLKDNIDQPAYMILLAHYHPDESGMSGIRDQLMKYYRRFLKPEDWQAVADGYWQQLEFGKGAEAYMQATPTPENLYRAGRGFQNKGKRDLSIKAFTQVIQKFPKAPEAGVALRRLAELATDTNEKIKYLDRAIQSYPDSAPYALYSKAKLLEKQKKIPEAQAVYQTLLTKYPSSDKTSEYRWEIAQQLANKGKLQEAWQWAQPITQDNPNSVLSAKAAFWIGKWATRLNLPQEAQKSFTYVLAYHPQSYYAWRSALMLGWDVGNYNTIREQFPLINKPALRPQVTAGSMMFKELYYLGEDSNALAQFYAEIGKRQDLTLDEAYTQSLLRLIHKRYMRGINQILALKDRQSPEDQKRWQELRKTDSYWQALFPLAYPKTVKIWSEKYKVNPLLVTGLMRQESRFEYGVMSPVGATGLMQVMPGTGKWIASQLDLPKYSLLDSYDNVNLGTWYLGHVHDEYQNNSILAVASYNAGPGNVAKWIDKYGFDDPDQFVESIPFDETKNYVEAVLGNYWNYLRLYNPEIQAKLAPYIAVNQEK